MMKIQTDEIIQDSEKNNKSEQIKPTNYLIWSILTTVLCCMPFGIPAIVFAAMTNSYWESGRYEEAKNCSEKAKLWSIISAVAGLLYIFIVFACAVCGIIFSELLD